MRRFVLIVLLVGASSTATSCSGDRKVQTTEPLAVASVTVVVDSSDLLVGRTHSATAVLQGPAGEDLTGRPVVWSSSNGGVATVSTDGTISGVSRGYAAIRATSGGASDEIQVRVFPAVPRVPFDLDGWGNETSEGAIFTVQWQHDNSEADITEIEWRREIDETFSSAGTAGGMATEWRSPKTAQSSRYPMLFPLRRCAGEAPLRSCSEYSDILYTERVR